MYDPYSYPYKDEYRKTPEDRARERAAAKFNQLQKRVSDIEDLRPKKLFEDLFRQLGALGHERVDSGKAREEAKSWIMTIEKRLNAMENLCLENKVQEFYRRLESIEAEQCRSRFFLVRFIQWLRRGAD